MKLEKINHIEKIKKFEQNFKKLENEIKDFKKIDSDIFIKINEFQITINELKNKIIFQESNMTQKEF